MNRYNKATSAGQPGNMFRAWVVCLVAGLFFFYEFIQMNVFNRISEPFMQEFHISAVKMGGIDSFYFLANVLFLVLAGYLLDRFSSRRLILGALLFCIIGTLGIAATDSLSVAAFCRFLTGIGSAFCFLSCIRLATRWFSTRYLGLVIGIIVTEAMLGGMVSQSPLSYLVTAYGWRYALMVDALLGLLVFIGIYLVVHDSPTQKVYQNPKGSSLSFRDLFRAFSRTSNWLIGLYTSLMNLPLGVLGGIWGIFFLTREFQLSHTEAGVVTTVLFLGMMIGSPLAGFISDSLGRRKGPMLWGAFMLIIAVSTLLSGLGLSYFELIVIFFIIGLFSGMQVIGYPLVAEMSSPEITAMSVSVVNIITQAGLGLMRTYFGYLTDLHAQQTHPLQPGVLSGDFYWASWLFPIGLMLAVVAVIFLREKNKYSLG